MGPASIPLPRRVLCAVASTATTDPPGLEIAAADRRAAQHALELAAEVGAAVRFVHVVDFLDMRGHESAAVVQQLAQDELVPALIKLEQAAARLGVPASRCLVRGKAWYELLREAHRWSADLLVLTPKRDELSFGDRFLHGSTATRVLRKAPCPVWIVDPRTRVGTSRVLALVDRSPVSRRVVAAADGLAEAFGAERFALHCLDHPHDIALIRLPDAREAIERYHADVLADARKDLRRLTGGEDAGWTLLFENDWVVRQVPRTVEEHDIDLVVLGGVSGRALAGVLLGTTAEKLLERCQVSAYLVRPEGWVSPVAFHDPAGDAQH